MIEKFKLTSEKAKEKFEDICEGNLSLTELNDFDSSLREKLIAIDDEVENTLGILASAKPYQYDLAYAIRLYRVLNTEYQFNERLAAQDDIWRYMALRVIPDLVQKRNGLSESRFYKAKRRIWLRSLWWYIHLSWQGNEDDTNKVLQGNTTDEIMQLLDRTGSFGYRIDFSRELMRQYSLIDSQIRKRGLFRKVMKLNTMRAKVIEPSLMVGGTEEYVRDLISYFVKTLSTQN